ncbi:MAG: DivIVA domain-containing protein [Clostridia bacterium]
MNYNVLDIQNLKIKKVAFGYAEDTVKEILDKICEDYTVLTRENYDLKEKLSVLNDGIKHYKTMEESLQSTLIIAQQTGEEVKRNAVEKADNIMREAELKAQQIVMEANKSLAAAKNETEEALKRSAILKIKLENILKTELELLNQIDDKL